MADLDPDSTVTGQLAFADAALMCAAYGGSLATAEHVDIALKGGFAYMGGQGFVTDGTAR